MPNVAKRNLIWFHIIGEKKINVKKLRGNEKQMGSSTNKGISFE
jgi:hypothetical protein